MAFTAWQWLSRGLALACLPLAFAATYDSAVAYWAAGSGMRVPAILANDPRVRWAGTEPRTRVPGWLVEHGPEARQAAIGMLRIAPLDSGAVRTLAAIAEVERSGGGTAGFRLAERVTRRDAATQLALIGAAGESGDIREGLTHYDRMLRTAPNTETVLFPTLNRAIAYDTVRAPLAAYSGRDWFVRFIGRAAGENPDPGVVKDLFNRAYSGLGPVARKSVGLALAARLLHSARLAEARTVAARVPGFAEHKLDDFGITTGTTDASFAPFAWTLRNDETVTTDLTNGGALAVRVNSGPTRSVAERTTLTPPGRYLLALRMDATPGEPIPTLIWKGTCNDGTSIAELRIPAQPGSSRFSAPIEIPATCAGLAWQLSATPEETQAPSSIAISNIVLIPR